jgi:flagella basal body P-ring formation protein FlgA
VVLADSVEPPKVVRRGELVTMIYATKGMALSARGRALADAAVGEPVTVLNEQSKRIVEGVAVGPDKVEIGLRSLKTAAAIASRTVE